MARIDAAADGTLLRLLYTAEEEAQYPDAHPGTVAQLHFDATSNLDLVTDLRFQPDAYRFLNDVLSKDRQPITIAAPPPPPPSLNEQLAAALAALPQNTAVTGAQLASVIALLRGA